MCGIAGIVCHNNAPDLPEHLLCLTDSLRHRGPDDEGFAFFSKNQRSPRIFGGADTPDSVYQAHLAYTPHQPFNRRIPEEIFLALGHRRLSILDLSPAGHQPMCNEDGSLWIIYNGEIYNFQDVRAELLSCGHRFVSQTDTEVILHAYEQWGEDCLHKFNGMWAFVIYDAIKNVLFGARDRFGVKPLYYSLDQHFFVFASEIKALLALPVVKKDVCSQAVFDYLVLDINAPQEQGFFQQIYELRPAYAFYYNLAQHALHLWQYYTLEFSDAWETFSEQVNAQYVERLKQHALNAVKLRLHADVPVGSCLSGGIDSSSIVCLINQLLQQESFEQIGERQKVFTASYPGERIDESQWAQRVVENTHTAWYRTFPTAQEFLTDLEDLVYAQDMPFGSTSIYAQYCVMKLARACGVKVLLDGQGGDEIFTGYPLYYRAFFLEMLKHLAFGRMFHEGRHLSHAPIQSRFLFLSTAKLLWGKLLPSAFTEAAYRRARPLSAYYHPDFWRTHRSRISIIKRNAFALTSLNHLSYDYCTGPHLQSLLRYEDRNSMRFSIESRTPFADDLPLITFMFHIPSSYKIRNGWSKYLFRRAMDNIAPQPILARHDKIGFATPEDLWLSRLRTELQSYITPDLQDYFDVKSLLHDWDMLFQNQRYQTSSELWRIINLAVWKKIFGV